ncbi:MAG: nucleoside triphosphate pyrophosphohydrolase [Bacteroidales bacterium]|nr:nucleoside triphosphate pyrophosphohydrolase [Bacteroidales bacterium]MCB9012868.1 nucleoside triphosphate pyrophosphohydrolase [Bacteroidales bacterium]
MNSKNKKLEAFGRLLDIMDELRAKCPWDKEQTFDSLRNLTIEETYELADAILEKDMNNIQKEVGDLLLHIVFYSKLGSETETFDIADVCDSLSEKLIFRHPHVFGDASVSDATNVLENWEDLKLKEGNKTVLGGVPKSLPAMIKANRIQDKVRAVGFDWDKREQIWDKVHEELSEVKEVIEEGVQDKIEDEFGDLFFSVINAARLYQVDPETALERTNKKFMKRFKYLEQETLHKGKSLREMSLEEMNVIWEKSKQYDDKAS